MNEAACLELPEYVSHKRVWALKIKSFEHEADVTAVRINFEDARYAPMVLPMDWYARVKQGDDTGYWVRYADGFESWSPTKAFEDGYALVRDGGSKE